MRMCLFFVPAVLMMSACGQNKGDEKRMIEEGRILVSTSDCKTCHSVNNRIIGPAHMDVAKKYETTDANVEMLADRIIKGGSGVWGETPMNPHADLSKEDAEKMALYVLSLDENTTTTK